MIDTALPAPVADARAAAQELLRVRAGVNCLGERRILIAGEYFEDLRNCAAESDGGDIWIEPGEAWLGGLAGAALAYVGTVAARDDEAAWLVREAIEDDNWPDLAIGTPLVEELRQLEVNPDETLWVRTGNMIVAGEWP
ncbi:hypothetical protein BH20CHL6_BH20CHL6_12220 [soil metagenome]